MCCPARGEKGQVTGGLELLGAHPAPVAARMNKVEHKLMYNQKVQKIPFLKRDNCSMKLLGALHI